ncbi:MAG: WG repeat-containing protein [Proteobacteria bacterium]|nr:WG repeat-containing protein [Pseudomonadota bacterium]
MKLNRAGLIALTMACVSCKAEQVNKTPSVADLNTEAVQQELPQDNEPQALANPQPVPELPIEAVQQAVPQDIGPKILVSYQPTGTIYANFAVINAHGDILIPSEDPRMMALAQGKPPEEAFALDNQRAFCRDEDILGTTLCRGMQMHVKESDQKTLFALTDAISLEDGRTFFAVCSKLHCGIITTEGVWVAPQNEPLYSTWQIRFLSTAHTQPMAVMTRVGYYQDRDKNIQIGLMDLDGKWLIDPAQEGSFLLYESQAFIEQDEPFALYRRPSIPLNEPFGFSSTSCEFISLRTGQKLNQVDLEACHDLQDSESGTKLFPVKPTDSGGLWGYMNLAGEMVIAAQFEDAGVFNNERAAIKRNGLYGYIDIQGQEIIKPQFLWAGFRDGDMLVKYSLEQARVLCNGAWGTFKLSADVRSACKDKFKKWAQAQRICFDKESCEFQECYPNDGDTTTEMAMAEAGFAPSLCEECSDTTQFCEWFNDDDEEPPRSGRTLHFGWALIDAQDQLRVRPNFEGEINDEVRSGFVNGLARIRKNNLYGYIDESGTEVIPPQFKSAEEFTRGTTLSRNERIKIELAPDHIQKLCNRSDQVPQSNNPKVIASCTNLKKSKPTAFESCMTNANQCHLGPLAALIDNQGKFISRFDYTDIREFHENRAIVKRYDRHGYIDENGNEVIEPIWERPSPFTHGAARVYHISNVRWHANYFDLNGKHLAKEYCLTEMFSPPLITGVTSCYQTVQGYVDANLNLIRSSASNTADNAHRWVADTQIGGYGLVDANGQWLVSYRITNEPMPTQSGFTAFSIPKHIGLDNDLGWINAAGQIIWPPHWNTPCTDTRGIVVWPEGACMDKQLKITQTHFYATHLLVN